MRIYLKSKSIRVSLKKLFFLNVGNLLYESILNIKKGLWLFRDNWSAVSNWGTQYLIGEVKYLIGEVSTKYNL